MFRARSNCQMVRLSVSSRWSGVHDSRWSGVRGVQVVRYPGGQRGGEQQLRSSWTHTCDNGTQLINTMSSSESNLAEKSYEK